MATQNIAMYTHMYPWICYVFV